MYTHIILDAILAGIIFGLGYGLFKTERRFQKIHEATLKVHLNPEKKSYEELMDELLKDIWIAMYK